jgi:chromosome segregation ATPase
MNTDIEQRFTSLEQQVNILRGVEAQQMLHNQETDKHLTMLLGIAKGQESDIRTIQADISTIKTAIASLKSDVATIQVDVASMKEQLSTIIALLTGGTQPKPSEP